MWGRVRALGAGGRGPATHLLCGLGQVIALSGPHGHMSEEVPPPQGYGAEGGIGSYGQHKVCFQEGNTFKVLLQTCRELLFLIVHTPILFWHQKATHR